jgi:glycosyltransferase involved in cell wall biosynthesis
MPQGLVGRSRSVRCAIYTGCWRRFASVRRIPSRSAEPLHDVSHSARQMTTAGSARSRVTMLVRNPYTHDTRIEREAATLVGAGFSVTIVAETAPGLPLREQRDAVLIVRVPRRGPSLPGLRFIAHQWRLQRALERTRPDILHAHDTDALQSAGPVGARLGIPVVFDSHELWLGRSARGRGFLYHRLAQAYYGWIERRYLPAAAAVMVANPPVAAILRQRYGLARVHEVPNYPVERGPVERRELRSLPGGEAIPDGAPIVLYVGGIAMQRGIEQLVDAMVAVPQAHLVFLGGGGLEPEIRRRVAERDLADRAHFLGMVPSADVVPFAASATVGIVSTMPTDQNNELALPNKIFQYMAASVPVVASDFPQIREVIDASACGVVYDPTDVSALAAAIRGYTEDPVRAEREGANGRRAVTERYYWDISAERILEVYRRVAGSPANGGAG